MAKQRISYVPLDFNDPKHYADLNKQLDRIDESIDQDRLPHREKLFSSAFAQQESASHQQHDHQQQ